MRKENFNKFETSANEETRNAAGSIGNGESGIGGEEGGVSGGNIVGGNPVEVALMNVASLLRRVRVFQRGASGPTLVTLWRPERAPCLDGQNGMVCSNVSGSSPQRGQEVSASGTSMLGGRPGSSYRLSSDESTLL